MPKGTEVADAEIVLEGRRIMLIRSMTREELTEEGWLIRGATPSVLILDNGLKLFAARDAEGNGPGMLFARTKRGDAFRIP